MDSLADSGLWQQAQTPFWSGVSEGVKPSLKERLPLEGIIVKWELKRGEALSSKKLPLPLEGKGIKGIG